MYYYHVMILEKGADNKIILHKDVNEKKLKSDFVNPFNNEDNIMNNGRIIENSDIIEIVIVRTEKPFDEVIRKKKSEFYKKNAPEIENDDAIIPIYLPSDRNMENYGENITQKYIDKAPKKTESLYKKITHNPLIVGIVSALVGAGAGALVTLFVTGC